MDVTERWEALVAEMLAKGSATFGNKGGAQRAFGATSLKTNGKIFAMLVQGQLVVKLPAARVGELVEGGVGGPFDPGHGRIQKQWLAVHGLDPDQWHALATESEAFVAKRTDLPDLTEHERQNRASWNADSDDYQARHGSQLAASTGLAWGTYQVPEAELRVLGDVVDRDTLEFGCGAAQWSIGLARLGARPVGIDLSERQLEHARRLMAEAGVDFPLIHGSAEHVPLPDASFDIVFCDHGAMTFADPYRTVPEAARLLRPGGLFAFNHGTPIETIAWPLDSDHVGDRLVLHYFGMHRIDDGETSTFQLPYGEWIRLFRANGFTIEDLIELRPGDGATSSYRNADDTAWARRWPAEEVWRVRKS